MKVYFIHSQDTAAIMRMHAEGSYPSHFLYGALELPQEGVEVVIDRHNAARSRAAFALRMAWRVLTCREHIDAVYGTSFHGLELLILLRAIGLLRKPIALWHHQPAEPAQSWLRERFAKLFYRGIDRFFFFSQLLLEQSVACGKVKRERAMVVDWGYDLHWCALPSKTSAPPISRSTKRFVSTGKERRDMPTLIEGARRAGAEIDIYLPDGNCEVDYRAVVAQLSLPAGVRLNWSSGLLYGALAQTVAAAQCVCICCLPTNYTVGLTTVMEALALGLPMIVTKNATFPFDVEAEGVGLSVAVGDVDGWAQALRYMQEHPAEAREMGRRGRALAERRFNISHTARQVAAALKSPAS